MLVVVLGVLVVDGETLMIFTGLVVVVVTGVVAVITVFSLIALSRVDDDSID